eukprot:m.35035 g.35035  ORF g.35035 m.35035 type:complete len:79 (+) comp9841_c0_seq4:588-824(+)
MTSREQSPNGWIIQQLSTNQLAQQTKRRAGTLDRRLDLLFPSFGMLRSESRHRQLHVLTFDDISPSHPNSMQDGMLSQ